MTTIGFLQYLAPSGSFLLGVFLYHEPFTHNHLITFSLIWAALAIFTVEALLRWHSGREHVANVVPLADPRPSQRFLLRGSLTIGPRMTEDDFQYAIENTRVILAPERQIASFGSTSFRFYLISELMDQVNEVRVRDGRIHAERRRS